MIAPVRYGQTGHELTSWVSLARKDLEPSADNRQVDSDTNGNGAGAEAQSESTCLACTMASHVVPSCTEPA